ncbi:hypothetical protein M3A96_11525 [Helcobacillus massiliensis]|uniref:hypothetical protein n=1 Tax=Helcobacillus TaxID=1161125 RepID=UPI001EF3EF75|nr:MULTISPECIES: hypothetical protein [Helcobacillus]MCG7426095.1 hypothetical protein [Helcobacillus sp. ACRRO]MCT1558739.1 hypothetical protein [Helcobacillus massiliensis]MCT2037465.1 hypothetical protein [Helcobacillus massiliensis]MCT2332969.1 hypothetical protein [Helcobacillus massiliensis]MDK7741475.1 hypothetical protein [Helcobacillus massiliensis]
MKRLLADLERWRTREAWRGADGAAIEQDLRRMADEQRLRRRPARARIGEIRRITRIIRRIPTRIREDLEIPSSAPVLLGMVGFMLYALRSESGRTETDDAPAPEPERARAGAPLGLGAPPGTETGSSTDPTEHRRSRLLTVPFPQRRLMGVALWLLGLLPVLVSLTSLLDGADPLRRRARLAQRR